jgi:hypothetical protein
MKITFANVGITLHRFKPKVKVQAGKFGLSPFALQRGLKFFRTAFEGGAIYAGTKKNGQQNAGRCV